MRKFFLFALLFAATAMFADDAVVVEAFSQVVQPSSSGTAGSNWVGDVCNWTTKYARRGTNDKINSKQATWLTLDKTVRGYIKTTDLEGGIKAVSFDAAQFGTEAANTLVWQVTAGTLTDTIKRDGAGGPNKDNPRTYLHAFECKENAQLEILNMTVTTATGVQPSNNGRLLVGDITITPYLLYKTKKDTLDLRKGVNTYTNTDLINNIDEGAVVYSISENTIGATINASTGEVTATNDGEVTITATWGKVSTSYLLTILAKEPATASFAKASLIVKINESAPANEFTTNSTATVAYTSSETGVATVDAATGVVSIVGLGTTVITANVPENEVYKAASASYTLRVVPENWKCETFESAEETASYYANPAESTTGDICQWTAWLGGVKHMTDAGYIPMFGEDNKYTLFRAPRQQNGETPAEDPAYIESDSIEGGISYIKFRVNPTAAEASTTWDIRVFVNGVQVGDNLTGFAAAPQMDWTVVTIPNINVDGKFVIRFENHSTLSTAYTSGNKGRLAIDDIEWEGYEAPCEGQYGILVDGTKYIAGVKNEEQKEWLEYTITADLKENQTFVFEDHCTGGTFMAGQDNGEGNYKFNYTEGENPVFLVPKDGHFTIYLKMYGPDNNWIWTVYADPTTGVENTAVKADVRKAIENGKIVIYRNGVRYTMQGQVF